MKGDSMSESITESERLLLRLLANALFDGPMPELNGDSGPLWREANQQAVFLLALNRVDFSGFSPEQSVEMRNAAKACLTRNLRIARCHTELSGTLEHAGVPHVMIKGLVSALRYPEPELRQLGDIDFYVNPSDVRRTEELLTARGYEPLKTSHSVHHVYRKDGCRYELHFEIPGIPEGETGEKCREFFRDMIERSVIEKTSFGEMRVPSLFHQGLITLLHMAHHLTNSGIGLRHLCDWAVFVAAIPDGEYSAMFSDALQKLGLRRFARCLTELCVRYLGCPVNMPLSDEKLSDEILSDILAGGNFGQKDIARTRQAYLITSGSAGRSKLLRFLHVLTDMVCQKWPVAKKCRLLIPFGWIYYSIKYLIRAAAGKRPGLYARRALSGAVERTGIYDRLRLFEEEKESI